MRTQSDKSNIVIPNKRDVRLAEESSRILASLMHAKDSYTMQMLLDDEHEERIKLPASAVKLLLKILTQMAEGNAISIFPVHKELTTQEAADLLNVSRPFLVKLLENGEIPFHKVGTKRRVLAKDVIQYKETIDEKRYQTLEELTAQSQELNMGYDDDE